MAALMPMALYGLEVPCGDVAISARPEIQSAFRITMAAIDPTAEAEGEEGAPQRATLKVIRQPLSLDDFSDEDDEDDDDDEDDFDVEDMERMLAEEIDDEDDEDEDDEEVNGGPSDPSKSKKARKAAAAKQIAKLLKSEGMDVDDDDEDDDDEDVANGINGSSKSVKAMGKMPVDDLDDDEDLDDDDDDEDDSEDGEIEEFVICTLDPSKTYQQALDITIGEDERVWFKVTGTHSIYLTGNYVEAAESGEDMYDPEDDSGDDYDLEPDMDEIDGEDEEDELDDMSDPRITELMEEDDVVAPKLVEAASKKKDTKADKKGNKRSAPESADEGDMSLDAMIQEEAAAATTNGEKLSKKQLKKLKKNDGSAAAVDKVTDKPAADELSSAKSDKKVSFAKNLEQGPTPTKAEKADKPAEKDTAKGSLGVKKVQGVTIDDKKLGTGPAAKNGDRVGMRYIGKLAKDGKVFDSNKKGKPFTFKLGAGEVIKGWEIGIQGMSTGGERRITIPASLAYGSKASGPIPANSTLTFDVKLLELNKGK